MRSLPPTPARGPRRGAARTTAIALAAALALAAAPPAAAQGAFPISDTGADGDLSATASSPAVAYNPVDDELLVVWVGNDDGEEYEVYGQRLDAATGAELGVDDFRVSDMGVDGESASRAWHPAVAWDFVGQRWLVVWAGDDDTPPRVNGEAEIYGQFLAPDGTELGVNDFPVSEMGVDGDPLTDAFTPAIAHDADTGRFLVVWAGDDLDGELEIWGQLLDPAGDPVGGERRLSTMGPDGETDFDAEDPAVAWSMTDGGYLVVWSGDDTVKGTNGEFEIYGQLLDADANEVGADDFRISSLGPPGDPDFDARAPALTQHRTLGGWLVVWSGDGGADLGDDELEIWGQILAPDGTPIGADDFRISTMGPDGDAAFAAREPAALFIPPRETFLVGWWGDDAVPGDDDFELFAQMLTRTGAPVWDDELRLTRMGPDGDPAYHAVAPALAWTGLGRRVVVTWEGADDDMTPTPGEVEIFGVLSPQVP